MSDERTTLTEFLDLALAAGVPAEALERAGFDKDSEAEWWWWKVGFRGFPIIDAKTTWTYTATLAAERVVIEWLADNAGGISLVKKPGGYYVVTGVGGSSRLYRANSYTAALHTAIAAIKEAADA